MEANSCFKVENVEILNFDIDASKQFNAIYSAGCTGDLHTPGAADDDVEAVLENDTKDTVVDGGMVDERFLEIRDWASVMGKTL